MNKTQIAEKFTELKKYNFKVINFQSNRRYGKAQVGMSDILIIDSIHHNVIFIEIKVKDKQSTKQVELEQAINGIQSTNQYILAEPSNCLDIANLIFQRDYYNLWKKYISKKPKLN